MMYLLISASNSSSAHAEVEPHSISVNEMNVNRNGQQGPPLPKSKPQIKQMYKRNSKTNDSQEQMDSFQQKLTTQQNERGRFLLQLNNLTDLASAALPESELDVHRWKHIRSNVILGA